MTRKSSLRRRLIARLSSHSRPTCGFSVLFTKATRNHLVRAPRGNNSYAIGVLTPQGDGLPGVNITARLVGKMSNETTQTPGHFQLRSARHANSMLTIPPLRTTTRPHRLCGPPLFPPPLDKRPRASRGEPPREAAQRAGRDHTGKACPGDRYAGRLPS